MVKIEKLLHEKNVNLARRWSVQNEPDLLGMEEDDAAKARQYSRRECESIASHLQHLNQLPTQCVKYQEVAADLRRRDSDTTHGSQVLS